MDVLARCVCDPLIAPHYGHRADCPVRVAREEAKRIAGLSEVDRLREQLQGAVKALDAVRVWLASPQRPRDRLRGIERALIDPEYAAQIAALKGQ